jgi:hypothetical protein
MTFDSFECTIQAIAPRCAHCGWAVIGHGVEASEEMIFCCVHRSKEEGVRDLQDRTSKPGCRLTLRYLPRMSGNMSEARNHKTKKGERGKRLAAALKANLRRRKEQARQREQRASDTRPVEDSGKDTP